MIDFEPGEDEALLLDAVGRFADAELVPRIRGAERARAVDPGVAAYYRDLGITALELPEPAGAGLPMTSRCLVNARLAQADPGQALALDPIGPAGAAARACLDGEALTERFAAFAGADPGRAWLVLAEDDGVRVTGDRVSGMVPWVPDDVAQLWIVAGAELLVVTEGLTSAPVRGAALTAAGGQRLTIERAGVAGRFTAGPAALANARLYVASLLLGVLEETSRYAREYAMERIAFGKPIAHHQALTFLLTDMNTAVTGCRLLILDAAWRVDAGFDAVEAAAGAFAETVEQSRFVGPNGVQVLGGSGFMQDFPVEKHMRDARALGLLLGGIDAARRDAARALDDESTAALMAGGTV